MKRILIILLLILFIALFWQLYQLYLQNKNLKKVYSNFEIKAGALKKENFQLQADLEYFKEPANLEKELRSRFNYKKSGEKLIIVIPSNN